ncbi:hypothetical protein TCON_1412 [Astathelohania contejeani]|uniref:CTLH/CRA C-terminal to LisH motif domain-containing protein n=1 Tax=Astathelohania contejeani TaxID=164912 RepID=A0ABQ7HZ30_9MICR|nr:hypothetical protein TCON_1412 [Thelohania contejeani]
MKTKNEKNLESMCEEIVLDHLVYIGAKNTSKIFAKKLRLDIPKDLEELENRNDICKHIRKCNLKMAFDLLEKSYPYMLNTDDEEEKEVIKLMTNQLFIEYVRNKKFIEAVNLGRKIMETSPFAFNEEIFSLLGYKNHNDPSISNLFDKNRPRELGDRLNRVLFNRSKGRKLSLFYLLFLQYNSIMKYLRE